MKGAKRNTLYVSKIMDNLGFYLNRAFVKLVNTLNYKLTANGIPINHSQFEVLQLLWNVDSENLSQQEIANIIGRDKAAISRALTCLERQGYIERRPVSGSKNCIVLTEQGINIRQPLASILSNAIEEVCKPLTDDESRYLVSLLKTITV